MAFLISADVDSAVKEGDNIDLGAGIVWNIYEPP